MIECAKSSSVLRWVCGYVDHCCTKPPPGDAVVIELDEMWHFPQRNDTRSGSGRPTTALQDGLSTGCSDCDERVFRRLFERLTRWKVRLFCSDSYVVQA